MRKIVDSDGVEVTAGCTINFAYGIPPVPVMAEVIERNGALIALTPGHNPSEARVSTLKRHVGDFWVVPCKHMPMKAALDDSVHCIRCGTHLGEAQ